MQKKMKMNSINSHILHIVLLFIVGCRGVKEDTDYVKHFNSSKNEMNILANYLEFSYLRNGQYRNQTRLIFNNPIVESYALPKGIKDSIVFRLMQQAGIATVHIESEGEVCDSSLIFNKIYFRYLKNEPIPTVDFILDMCRNADTAMYKSETIRKISLDNEWTLFIDHNFP